MFDAKIEIAIKIRLIAQRCGTLIVGSMGASCYRGDGGVCDGICRRKTLPLSHRPLASISVSLSIILFLSVLSHTKSLLFSSLGQSNECSFIFIYIFLYTF